MPVSLYHGPASLAKEKRFLNLAACDFANTLILTNSKTSVNSIRQKIYSNSSAKSFLGENILTWHDFLFQGLKKNKHRAHFANADFCGYLLTLLRANANRTRPASAATQNLAEIYALFQQIKKSPQANSPRPQFGLPLVDPSLVDIYQHYNHALNARHFYDEGDLYKITLNELAQNAWQWVWPQTRVILYQVYPLGPGEREVLRRAKQAFPQIDWQIFYDEDYARSDDLLSLAFEDLGQLSDSQEHVPAETVGHTLHEFTNPAAEIDATIASVERDLANGLTPEHIALAIPASYQQTLLRRLKQHDLPCVSHFGKLCRTILPHSETTSQTAFTAGTQELFLAAAALDEITANKTFAQTVFADLLTPHATEALISLEAELRHNATYTSQASAHQIVLIPHREALAWSARKIYLMGLTLENLTPAGEINILHEAELKTRDWAEPLALPSYQFKMALENLKHALQLAPTLVLSRSLFDASARPTTPLPLDSLQSRMAEAPASKAPAEFSQVAASPQSKQKFSVSELQTFRDCPYKYYTRHVLRLPEVDSDTTDMSALTRGNVLHSILQTLLQEHRAEFLDFLAGRLPANVWEERIAGIVTAATNQNAEWLKSSDAVQNGLKPRFVHGMLKLHTSEQEWYLQQKKQTLPHAYEWPFEIKIGGVLVSGRIDRVDISPDGAFLSVVDYKSSRAASATDIRLLRDVQMAIYLKACAQHWPEASLSAGLYYSFKEQVWKKFVRAGTCDSGISGKQYWQSDESWQDTQTRLEDVVHQITNAIQAGQFVPAPRQDSLCNQCASRRLCPRFHSITISAEADE